MPACSARIVQIPDVPVSVISEAFGPLLVQTDAVSVLKLTTKPDDAVALMVNGADVAMTPAGNDGAKVIV